MILKIMNYNILFGFYDKDVQGKATVLNERRLQAARELVQLEKPDVLVLCEAFFGDLSRYPNGMDYQTLFDFPYSLGGWYEEYNGQIILSRYPLVKQRLLPIGHSMLSTGRRQFLLMQLNVDGKLLSVLAGYAALGTEKQKQEDWTRAFADTDVKNAERLIVIGDLNALSDEDSYDRAALITVFKAFINAIPEFHGKTAEEVVDDFLSRRSIPFIRSQGLVDTHRVSGAQDYTFPTDLISKDKSFALRIDYIFATPNLIIKDAYVVRSAQAEAASDHYPIVTVFEV